jgi:hypothetical protein
MKALPFPYERFEGTKAWQVLDLAFDDLVKNNDLQELTHRRYLIGYLLEALTKEGVTQDPSES